MRKRLIFVSFIFVLIFFIYIPFSSSQESCVDGDDGINLGVSSKAYGKVSVFSTDYSVGYRALGDYCEPPSAFDPERNWIFEGVCTDNGPAYIKLDCENGCENGVCIGSPNEIIESSEPPTQEIGNLEDINVLYAMKFTMTPNEIEESNWIIEFANLDNSLSILYGIVNLTFDDGSSKIIKFMRIGEDKKSKRFIDTTGALQFVGYNPESKSDKRHTVLSSSDKIFEGYNTKLHYVQNITNVISESDPHRLTCGVGGCEVSSLTLQSTYEYFFDGDEGNPTIFNGTYEADLSSLEEEGNRENLLLFIK